MHCPSPFLPRLHPTCFSSFQWNIMNLQSSKYDSCTKSGLTIVPRRPLSREPPDRAIRRSGPFNCWSVRALTRPSPVKLENRALANRGLREASTDASAGFVSRASTVCTGLRRHGRAPPWMPPALARRRGQTGHAPFGPPSPDVGPRGGRPLPWARMHLPGTPSSR